MAAATGVRARRRRARIVFGPARVREVGGDRQRRLGGHALLVAGSSNRHAARSPSRWRRPAFAGRAFSVDGEPTVDTARAGTAAARAAGCDLVIGFGGGSALDAAKAIAALVANGGDPLDYLEVVGRGQPLLRPSLPFIAIPTTAGTGSEVTKNAVLASPEHGVKASLRSPLMLARVAIVDPDLLAGLPPAVLAASGLDALSQLIEPFLSIRANPATDALAREGIRRSAAALPRAHAAARAGGADRRPTIAGAGARQPRSAGCAWRTPGSAPCTDSRRRWEECSRRRTAPSARPCCPPCCA